MTIEEIAERIGVEPAILQRWVDLGLIAQSSGDAFDADALERARLLQIAARGVV